MLAIEQSPIQVLTELNVAWLQWSYENWYFQVDKLLRPFKNIYYTYEIWRLQYMTDDWLFFTQLQWIIKLNLLPRDMAARACKQLSRIENRIQCIHVWYLNIANQSDKCYCSWQKVDIYLTQLIWSNAWVCYIYLWQFIPFWHVTDHLIFPIYFLLSSLFDIY